MKVRVWRYEVADAAREEFEHEYGPDGAWAKLFARSAGFVDTVLYAEVGSPGRYLTVDRFSSDAAWERFRVDHDTAYRALGERLGHLTLAQDEVV